MLTFLIDVSLVGQVKQVKRRRSRAPAHEPLEVRASTNRCARFVPAALPRKMEVRDEDDGSHHRRRHLGAVGRLRPPQAPGPLPPARGGAEPRRGDPDRDAQRVPARGRAGLDARAEAGGHRPLPRAGPRRAPRSHEPRPALRLHPPPEEAPPASRGDDAGRPDEDPALRPQRPVLLARQAPHGPRPRDPGWERARGRVDRLLPSAAVRAGGGRSPRRAAARRHPRRRPRAALDPRHLPALPRPRGEAREPRARDVGDAAAEPGAGGEASRRVLLSARGPARDGGRARGAPRPGADLDEGRRARRLAHRLRLRPRRPGGRDGRARTR